MKSLFKSKYLDISLVKGFVFGFGLPKSNTYFSECAIFLGPIVFEVTYYMKKSIVKSANEL